ncbi:hypothetical protein [Dysosmobacter welbionis]|uniref:hypothetical protein n=1 Tax=Dysosmobacter welbionis TaxID=2093857 RepID=UPI003079F1D4
MSFTRLLGYAVLCQVLTVAAGLLFVALLLGIFWLAHKLGHIEGERWEQYFQSVSTAGLLLRVGAVMAVALAAVAALSVPLFARLGFQEPGLLAALFFVARGAYLLNKVSRRRDELIQKLLKRGEAARGRLVQPAGISRCLQGEFSPEVPIMRTAVRCYHKMEIPSWKNKY